MGKQERQRSRRAHTNLCRFRCALLFSEEIFPEFTWTCLRPHCCLSWCYTYVDEVINSWGRTGTWPSSRRRSSLWQEARTASPETVWFRLSGHGTPDPDPHPKQATARRKSSILTGIKLEQDGADTGGTLLGKGGGEEEEGQNHSLSATVVVTNYCVNHTNLRD